MSAVSEETMELPEPTLREVVGHLGSWARSNTAVALWGVVLLAAFAWAYASTFGRVVGLWDANPDYSHGCLVIPVSLFFLWARRGSFPADQVAWSLVGFVLVLAGAALHVAGAWLYFLPMDGWSIPLTLAGIIWLIAGLGVLGWAFPAVAFLFFMLPLPSAVESTIRLPLQQAAAWLASGLLNAVGLPALAEKNTILLGDMQLEVEQACSGLRMLFGITALAFAYVVLVRRPWWQKVILVLFIVPIVLLANAIRVTATGVAFQYFSGVDERAFSHDIASWMMIPLAALMFWLVLWYLGRLFIEVRPMEGRDLVRYGREAVHG